MPQRPARTRSADGADSKRSSAILALQRELQSRLVSTGGRPADAESTIRRLVPVRARVWRDLATHASRLSKLGRRISVGQLAAFLLERGFSDLQLSSSVIR